ncbi:NAD(P)H-quinone oxidoreductase [Corynebacterium sp. S7]
MRAIRVSHPGGPETLRIEDVPIPRPSGDEVLIKVSGAGLNRADTLQREGGGNLPAGATDILGMEVSGTIVDTGEEVVALLSSGGYAEYVSAPKELVLPKPQSSTVLEAAALPEVAATVVSNIFMIGHFQPGETVLIHGATGGVGTFAIQLIKALGGKVAVTASSDEKLQFAANLGADILINYRDQDFSQILASLGGADIILDTVAGPYLDRNLQALNTNGRIVTIGRQDDGAAPLDFRTLMKKKASVTGTLLRDRPLHEKAEIMRETHKIVWPLLESGQIQPVIDRIFPLSKAVEAHEYFDSNKHIGKILLDCEK